MNRRLFASVCLGQLIFLTCIALVCLCPCENAQYCNPVHYDRKEVHGFVLESGPTEWKSFNWSKLTTVSLIDFVDDQLMCLAHQNDVRIITQEAFKLQHLENSSYVHTWLQQRIEFAQQHYLDGINIFVDDPVEKGSHINSKLTEFVQLVSETFHAKLPKSLVAFSVPYSPYNKKKTGVEGKNYDFETIAKAVDQLIILSLDQRKQFLGERCIAGPSSSFYETMGGILAYRSLNLTMEKMVLALPYYAHDYLCVIFGENIRCEIERAQYRGVNCSSIVATAVPFNQMKKYGPMSSVQFDEHSAARIYDYLSEKHGYVRQVWFDPQNTLELKFQLVDQQGLRGIGMWALNYLDARSWQYVPNYKNKPIL